VEVIVAEEGPGSPGKVQVAWEVPENFTQDDHFVVQWADMPPNYEEYSAPREAHGRNSIVIDVPPQLPERCVSVKTVSPNGQASEAVEQCL
jgi:hypothetical protein